MASPPRYAPIALFAFKRPEHTLRTLQALSANAEFRQSQLHVFCDAGRHTGEEADVARTREIVARFDHPHKTITLAPMNQGLARSITSGVTSLCAAYGRVIAIEDDLLVAPTFLDYMNRALTRYADEPRLMQVSGYMFPVEVSAEPRSVLLPFTTSWGWATWQRSWSLFDSAGVGLDTLRQDRRRRVAFDLDGSYPYFRMLQQQSTGGNDSWAIKWYLSVFLRSGLVLYPSRSLVENIGFDGSGTHCAPGDAHAGAAFADAHLDVDTALDGVDHFAYAQIKAHLKRERGFFRALGDWKSRLVAA